MNKEKLKGKNAIIYCRVSTEEQKELGNSLKHQEDALVEFCKRNSMNLLDVYSESKSAKTLNRPELNKIIKYIETHPRKVDYLLVLRWDRLSRNTANAVILLEEMKNQGVRLNATEQWTEGSTGAVIKMMSLSIAEMENTVKSRRTLEGYHKAIEEGRYPYSTPKGYMKIKNEFGKTVLEPKPNEWNHVSNIFHDFLSGNFSQLELISKYKRIGFEISKSSLSRMLQNIVYTGKLIQRELLDADDIEYGMERREFIVDGIHRPIISLTQYERIQGLLKKN